MIVSRNGEKPTRLTNQFWPIEIHKTSITMKTDNLGYNIHLIKRDIGRRYTIE